MQESLLAIHNQRHTYGVGQPLTPWIQAISKYKLVDLLRRRERCELLTDSMDSTCLAAFVLARADEVTRVRLFYGDTWNVCPFLIVMRRRRCLWA